jgi:subtilisin family serine protease
MSDKGDIPSQTGQYEKPQLQPIEDVLEQEGYPQPVIENYARLIRKDLHLAEFYRRASAPAETGKGRSIRVNPIQASVDSDGRILVDVLLELMDGVSVKELYDIMEIHGSMGRLVAGRVYAERAPELIEKAIRIETSRPIARALDQSVPSMKGDQETLADAFPAVYQQKKIDGSNVIIGIIDHGCDFKHANFHKDKKTRLLYLWDQTGVGNPKPASFNYGVEHDQVSINQALQAQNPYTALGYTPEKDAHGTHVMGIAAGNSSEFAGVAPGADIIFVELGKAANQAGQNLAPGDAELKSFGSSWNLFNAVLYILEKADQLNKPVVINISQAANGGPHDGTTMIESLFDSVLEQEGRAIVIAAGNSRTAGIHTSGEVQAGNPQTISWRIDRRSLPTSEIRHEMEIWYDNSGGLVLQILNPQNVLLGECNLNEEKLVPAGGGFEWSVLIRNLRPDGMPGDDENLINVFVDDRALQNNELVQDQVWRLVLSQNPVANTGIRYHAWIERNDPSPSSFATNSQPDHTINTIGNAVLPIVVGAYDSHDASFSSLVNSSEGPTRNRKTATKPDLSAPGWRIYSARAQTEQDGLTLSGTSMAAPHVSGLIALMFQAGRDFSNSPRILDIAEIRDALLSTADVDPPFGGGHHPRYGFGRVNAVEALEKIIN